MTSILDFVPSHKAMKMGLACPDGEAISYDSLTPAERAEWDRVKSLGVLDDIPSVGIDLVSLLSMRREDGNPLWTIANPDYRTGYVDNGGTFSNGTVYHTYSSRWFKKSLYCGFTYRWRRDNNNFSDFPVDHVNKRSVELTDRLFTRDSFVPVGGFPIMPPRVRELFMRCKAANPFSLMVLYQPISWQTVKYVPPATDPALLIQKTAQHEIECVAVWGHDGPNIKEFTFD